VPSISESFETVISNSTLEHISNIDEVINEVYRLLKKGGKLYVTLPTHNFDRYTAFYQLATLLKLNQLGYLYQNRFNKFWAHKHFMHPNQWVEKFEGLGFSCSKEINYGKKYQCILNEATVPFSIIAFILKKTLNRWSLSTKLKLVYGFPIYLFTSIYGSNFLTDRESAGLVFFEFTKK
jgi:SAM-dependent methyltransferase